MEVYDRKKYRHAGESLDFSGMTEGVADAYKFIVTIYFIIAKYNVKDARKYSLKLLKYCYEQFTEFTKDQKKNDQIGNYSRRI